MTEKSNESDFKKMCLPPGGISQTLKRRTRYLYKLTEYAFVIYWENTGVYSLVIYFCNNCQRNQ